MHLVPFVKSGGMFAFSELFVHGGRKSSLSILHVQHPPQSMNICPTGPWCSQNLQGTPKKSEPPQGTFSNVTQQNPWDLRTRVVVLRLVSGVHFNPTWQQLQGSTNFHRTASCDSESLVDQRIFVRSVCRRLSAAQLRGLSVRGS